MNFGKLLERQIGMGDTAATVRSAINTGSYCSFSRLKSLTIRPPDSLIFNPPRLSFQKLVGGCVSHLNCKSIGAFGGIGMGFQAKSERDLMVVSRVSPQEGFHVQGKNLASSDFKRLCREGKVEAALEAMNEMEMNGVLLDLAGLVKLLQVCEDKKLLGAGKRVFEYVTRSPSKPNTVVFNKLVDMFCKLGDTRTARTVFEKMAERNLDSWNKMLVGLAENGEGGEAIEFFFRMKKDGVRPDGSSFLGVIMACGCLGAVKEGQEHFVSMSRDHGITPSVEHYVAIVDLLGRSQKIAEAKEFIEKVPVESSSVVRETLQKYSTTETKGRLDEPSPSKSPSGMKVGNKRKVKGKLISRQKKSLKSAKKPPRILRKIPKGVIHIQASFNNTIVTVTDLRGGVICWSSAGSCKFKGTKRGTPFAAENAARNAIQKVVKHGMQRAEVMINGPGLGRDAALRAIRRSGIVLSFVRDVTPLPHNGCRPPKKRRV